MFQTRSAIWISFLCGCAILAWRATSLPPVVMAQPVSPNDVAASGSLTAHMREIQKEIQALSTRVELLIQSLRDHRADQPAKDETADLPPSSPSFHATWELSLRDAISICLQNSKVIRNLGGVVPFGVRGDAQTMLARINEDVSVETFSASLRNLISDLETTYWDVWLGHQVLETAKSLRDTAQVTWNRARNSEALDESQAREQYFFGRVQLEAAQQRLFDSEARLRFLMGLAKSDGRLIRASDEPDSTMPQLGPSGSDQLDALPEILKQRRNVDTAKKRLEQIPKSSVLQHRHESLNLAREIARLEDAKLNASHLRATAIRQVDRTYHTAQNHFNRWIAAREEVETLNTLYEGGLTKLDLVLDAQRRRAQTANDYHAGLVDFEKAKSALRFREGRVLDNHRLQIAGDIAISEDEGSPE